MSNESVNRLQIRPAKSSDAEAIIHVHYAAVHEIASSFYPSEILEAWSAKPGETRYQWMRNLITNGEEIVVVAEDESGIQGFGFFIPKMEELRALYVHPAIGHRGVGGQILEALEARAVALGISRLRLNASLNAEVFYRTNGYRALSRGKFRLSDEQEMDCVRMEKQFGGADLED
jgi:putative acetyltransferase